MENKFKFRASYSVLRLWEESRWEEAIKMYFHMDRWTSEAQADGKIWHEKWAEEIRQTGCKPAIFGGAKLKNPIVEKKIVVNIHDWLDLSFIMDLYDDAVLTDWKTGVTNSQDYARMAQIPVYAVGCLLANMPIKKAEIYAFNQHATFEPVSYSFRNIPMQSLQKASNISKLLQQKCTIIFLNTIYIPNLEKAVQMERATNEPNTYTRPFEGISK